MENAKLTKALEAINDLFGDTSVTPQQTKEALEELQADVEGKLDALNSDMQGD